MAHAWELLPGNDAALVHDRSDDIAWNYFLHLKGAPAPLSLYGIPMTDVLTHEMKSTGEILYKHAHAPCSMPGISMTDVMTDGRTKRAGETSCVSINWHTVSYTAGFMTD